MPFCQTHDKPAPAPSQATEAVPPGPTGPGKAVAGEEPVIQEPLSHESLAGAVKDLEAEVSARARAIEREHKQALGHIRDDARSAAMQARSLPPEPGPRRGDFPPPGPAIIQVAPNPEIKIGQIDVFVESPPRSRPGINPARPGPALASRHYLRRL